jgi:hypothetical protein
MWRLLRLEMLDFARSFFAFCAIVDVRRFSEEKYCGVWPIKGLKRTNQIVSFGRSRHKIGL